MTAQLKLGTVTPLALHVGGLAVPKAYLGATLVWSPITGDWGPAAYLLSDTPPPLPSSGNYRIGTRFQAIRAGRITGARFPRSATDALASHMLALYDTTDTRIAAVETVGEVPGTAAWIAVTFPTLLEVLAGSYFTVTLDVLSNFVYDSNPATVVRSDQAHYVMGVYQPDMTVLPVPLAWVLDGSHTPDEPYVGAYKVGNTYKLYAAGHIEGARFWRADAQLGGAELSHTVELWGPAQTLIATSEPSVETAGYTGWVEVTFPTPIPYNADELWSATFATNGFAQSQQPVVVVDGAKATFWTGRYAPAGGGFPATEITYVNYCVDLRFRPAGGGTPDPGYPSEDFSGGHYGIDALWEEQLSLTRPADPTGPEEK